MANWGEVLKSIKEQEAAGLAAVDVIRRKHLKAFYDITGRNVIAYYSGFLSKQEIASRVNIDMSLNHEDKNGFMMAINGMDTKKGLDLILHTPGGNIAATQSIVNYLHSKFGNNIRAIIPQIAMSAGTMIACSCKEILMFRHSNLGPIDPQVTFGSLSGPAHAMIQDFKKAYDEIKEDNSKILVWEPILRQYRPTTLTQCENAITWSDAFVKEQLEKVMFAKKRDAKKLAQKTVKALSDYRENKTHSNPLHYETCKKIGLNVKLVEEEKEFDQKFQDAVLTIHHCYMHSLMNTPSYKMIENHNGAAFVKQLKLA